MRYIRAKARLVKGPTRKSRFVLAIVKCPRLRILKALSSCTLSYDVLSLPQGTFPLPRPSSPDCLFTECLSEPEDIFCSELVVRRKLYVVLFDISWTNVSTFCFFFLSSTISVGKTPATARLLLDLTVIRNFRDGIDIASNKEIRKIKSNGVRDLRSKMKTPRLSRYCIS